MSGYQYNGVDLNQIVYNNGTNNTQGYNSFPGISTTAGTSEQIGINNYIYRINTNLLTNRIPFFIDYNTDSAANVNFVNGSNQISLLIIGASGGGGGGGGVNTNTTFSGGGGAQGGLYNAHMINKIRHTDFATGTYRIIIGNGGTGGGAGVKGTGTGSTSGGDGNNGNSTSITLFSANTQYNITVNGGTGGTGGNKGTANINGTSGIRGTDSTISFNNALLPSSTYLLNNFVYNNTNSKNAGGNGTTGANNRTIGGVPNVTQGIVDLGVGVMSFANLNYSFNNTYGRGGSGGAGGTLAGDQSNATGGGNGINGFVRVYYFFN